MPKYRNLTPDELKSLEEDFINYLIVNGIDAAEWAKIQEQDQTKAEEITELFSDVVFEKVLRQATYLRHQTLDSLHCFHYQEKQAVMIGLKSNNGELILDNNIPTLLKSRDYELITGNKEYTLQREQELFQMTLKGAEMSDGTWYKELAKML